MQLVAMIVVLNKKSVAKHKKLVAKNKQNKKATLGSPFCFYRRFGKSPQFAKYPIQSSIFFSSTSLELAPTKTDFPVLKKP
jgi:hypothetical protein